ncbi:T9SS type A sorting domain-containing protein [Hymenobacter antarcticus]|uniref:Gliding motility-associated C-terminal domain-containing protein n=1 Tax=Hymenobacter antarcticus TaxID=486270 RepID=A0ABP7QKS2_9BACT
MQTPLLANRLGRWLAVAVIGLLAAPAANAQLAGPKAIPGDYATVAAAITDLNTQGVGAGGVTFNIAAGYAETFASPTAGAITATGTAANPIVFQKAGAGANPRITAGVGTTTNLDAIISLAGSDYVTLDGLELAENAANATATTQMEFGIALFRPTPTDGCQNNTIRNCVVTLNKVNTGTFGIYGAATTAALATSVAATSPAGAHSSNKVNGTIITNSASGMYFTASTLTTLANYDQNNEIGVLAANQVYNFGTTATGWGIGGNYQNGFKVVNNVVNNTLNFAGGTTAPVAASAVTSTLRGIYGNSGPSASIDITGNTVTLASGSTASLVTGIDNGIGSTAAGNTVNITGNTVQLSSATTTSSTINGIVNSASAATVNLTGNTVSNCAFSAATTGSFSGVVNTASAGTVNLSTNTVTNNTATGTGSMLLVSGGAPTTLAMNGNTITGNSKTPAAPSTATTMQCLTASTTAVTASNNTISNNSITISGTSSSAGTVYGYYQNSSPTAETLTSNLISGLTVGGTSTSTAHVVAGIRTFPTATTVQVITQNTISALSVVGSGAGTASGMLFVSGGGAGSSIARNKIYNLSAGGTTSIANGIDITGGGTFPVANNLIGDLRAPAATGLSAVNGIQVNGATAANLYYNTIYLSASSTGATFGTTGISLLSTTLTLDLRNNIVVNKSTAVGTGGLTAALRRVSGTAGTAPANLAATTNNNLYFAGTPSATNVIYVEGTATATNAQQTLTAYKAFISPRESSSVTEDVPFLSTNGPDATFLHINPAVATQVEKGAMPIAGVSTDYDGDPRDAGTPDIGADEGAFTPLDLVGPAIALTPLGNTSSLTNRTITATITDASGVATGPNAPRLYFRKGTTGAFQFVNATTVSGAAYTFTFDYALVGGVAGNDIIQYYVAAQDLSAAGNVSTNPFGGSGANPPGTGSPASVYQYRVLAALAGTYYVGVGTSPDPARTYPTLTAAAAAYSNNGMGGPVTFLLLDNAYTAALGETFPVVFFNNPDASATNTLLIKPNTGATPVVTAAGSVLALAGTRYVTIDGSNSAGGTTRDLTLNNTALTANTYGLGLLTQVGLAQSNLFTTVRNVNVTGGGVTANATFGILLNGADNDDATLQNNSVRGVTIGIQAFGSTTTSAGGLDNLLITGNVVGPPTNTVGANINQTGIVVANALSPVVSSNEVQNIVNPTATSGSNMTGILLQDVKTGIVTRNSVHNLTYTGTSTAKLYGISTQLSTSGFNTAANPSATRFDNNLVYNLNSSATSASWNTSGINNNGGFGDQYYYNTVYLTGQLSATTGSAGSAAFSNGNGITAAAATNIDVRNNIFSIIGGTGGGATTGLYAHYTTLATYAGSTLNYNDLFVTVGANGTARIGRLNSVDAVDLAAWRTATAQEANSLSANPNFAQTGTVPFDLTPTAAALNNIATPIAGVTVDFPGTTRSTTPDIGAYEFTPAPIDVAATALVSPAAAGCFGAAETVTASFTNNATAALNLSLNPVTVTVVVTIPGGTTQPFTATLNTGTLAPNAVQSVTFPGTLNMSAVGTYSFAITASTPGDGTPGNDLLTVTRTVVGVATQPQLVTFTGFTGANLGTVFPGWAEATGATIPTGSTSAWTSTSFPAGNTTAKINLFSTGKNEWIVSPKFLATASTVLTFDAAITDFASTNPDPAGMTGTDDFVEVRISTDCGLTFARIPAFAQFNAGNQPGNGSLTNYSISLSTYAGQQIILAFFASEGTVDDTPDYDFHLDNLSVSSPLPIDLAPVALATPAATTSCYSAAETVSITVRNLGTQTLDFAVNPATVTAVVTTPGGPQTLTTTLSTGTLAPSATQAVTLAPTLDMTAIGTYSFAITATVQGDQVTGNDVLPAVTRTVAAPVAGTVTPATATLCVSGTSTLTLNGAANGTIQWQQSADNVTFTDVTGANAATFTTPVLTQTTYFRAQVRCATTATSNVATITVNNPLVTATNTPLAICAGSTATLTASSSTGTSVRFFGAATGGTALATAGTYTTPALTASTTYYAEAFTGGSENVGKATASQTDGGFSGGNTGLVFTAAAPVLLQTATVFNATATAGSVTVELRDNATGALVATAGPFAVPAGSTTALLPTVLPLNLAVPAAGSYRLVTAASPAPPTLYRDFSGNTYPYASASGAVTITGGYISGASSTYYYFYNIAVSTECASATRTAIQVNVTQPATASFPTATAATCGTSAYQLAGTVTGSLTTGTYTSSGTGTFAPNATTLNATYTPSAADVAAGSVTITLTSDVAGPCAATTATLALSISPAPIATFSYPATTTYCAGSTSTVAPTLGTGASAGTFSSTAGLTIDPATGVITLSTSTAGTYTVTNTVAASGACAAATATTSVTIAPATSAAFSYGSGTFCVSGSNPTATVTGTAGGTFSSTAGLTINATTGAITLGSSTPGTYTVTYSVGGACSSSSTQSVTITNAPVATFSYGTTPTFCVSSTTNPVPSFGTGASAGTFSSTTGLTIDATTGAITLASSTPGTYTVTNAIAAASGCAAATATASVTITAAPVATFSYPATTTYCAGSTSTVTPTLGTGATAGTFSSTTGLTINPATGVITLSTSTAGTYTVTNTIAAGSGCAATSATATVTITPATTATFAFANASFCASASNPSPTVTGTTGGTFTAAPAGLSINATTGAINLTTSTLGTYTVTYTVAGACGSSATASVTITAATVATFSYASATGCAGSTGTATPTLGAGASAGTFSSTTGLVINATTGAINLATSTAGTYTVTNTVAASGGCATATATTTFTVNPRPAAPLLTAAYNGTTTTLTSSATTGNQFFLNGVAIAGATGQTYVINGSAAQLGSYTVVVTNANGCASLPSTPLVVTAARNSIAGTSLRVYPNPTPTGEVTLELTGFRLPTQLTVLDALGRVVATELLPAAAGTAIHSLNLTGVATGVYLLRLSNTDGTETRRLVRQ